MPEPIVYAPHERPDVEVLVDGTWHQGELTMWRKLEQPEGPREPGWHATVRWRRGPGAGTHVDVFDSDHVRPDTVDRSRGRG